MSPLRPYQRQAIAGTLFALAVQLGLASVVVMASWWVMAESGWPLVAHVPAWLGMGGSLLAAASLTKHAISTIREILSQ